MAKKYGICDDKYGLDETTDTLEKAEKIFEIVKDNKMSNGVVIDESWVSIVESEDDFENETVIKKVVAVYDEETTKEIGTPEQNGYEWNYWAKWQEVSDDVDPYVPTNGELEGEGEIANCVMCKKEVNLFNHSDYEYDFEGEVWCCSCFEQESDTGE